MAANLEYKTRCPDQTQTLRRAMECGAADGGILQQEDTYFVVPSGRLKLRRFADGSAELIGYTRPDLHGARQSEYVKIPVGSPGEVLGMFAGLLGVRVVVRKRRRLFLYRGCRIHLDDVESLGSFLEFEVPVPGEEEPKVLLEELMNIFGVSPEDGVAGSYQELLCGVSAGSPALPGLGGANRVSGGAERASGGA